MAAPLATKEGRQLDLCQDCRGMVSQVALFKAVLGRRFYFAGDPWVELPSKGGGSVFSLLCQPESRHKH